MHPFVSALRALRFQNCFNPYADRCAIHDADDAPSMRAETLSLILDRTSQFEIDAIWIGRDLGYRGGRRTGLALTDDVHLPHHARRWGVGVRRPTIGGAVAERTAAFTWRLLDRIEEPTFLWNVFPLHPHVANEPFSNRLHDARERRAGEDVLAELVQMLKPRRLIAIGNDAAASAHRVGGSATVVCVRHPSYGGQTEFTRSMHGLYGLNEQGDLL